MTKQRKNKALFLSIVGYLLLELILLHGRWVCIQYLGNISLAAFTYHEWTIRIVSILIVACSVICSFKTVHWLMPIIYSLEILLILACSFIHVFVSSETDVFYCVSAVEVMICLALLISILITMSIYFLTKDKKQWISLIIMVCTVILTVVTTHMLTLGLFGLPGLGYKGIGCSALVQPFVILLPAMIIHCKNKSEDSGNKSRYPYLEEYKRRMKEGN